MYINDKKDIFDDVTELLFRESIPGSARNM
jgi:hypothetical protein